MRCNVSSRRGCYDDEKMFETMECIFTRTDGTSPERIVTRQEHLIGMTYLTIFSVGVHGSGCSCTIGEAGCFAFHGEYVRI